MAVNLAERDFEALRTEAAYRLARRDYYEYAMLANHGMQRSRLHKYICNSIQAFLEKPNPSPSFDVLLISMPPQHGKSTFITETAPSYYLGLHPEKDCLIISYSDDTASRFGRANKMKLEEFTVKPFDVVEPLFPNYKPGEVWNNTDICNTYNKFIRSRGIFGAITSNPADLIIIDDPIKTMEEAQSETTKEKIWLEYYASVRTRIKPKGKLIVIATRWVEDDLIGRLQNIIPSSRLTTLFLPCECTNPEHDPLGRKLGDALCPEIGRDNAWLAEFKAEYTSTEGLYTWSALYQCDPTPIAGAIINPAWWAYYNYEDELEFSQTYISVDCAFKDAQENDFVAIQVWSMVDDHYYLRAQIHDHLSFTATLEALREVVSDFPDYIGILIEDKANGSAVIDSLQNEYDGIIPVTPAGGKASRLHSASKPIRQGRVHLPRSAIFLDSYIREFTSFPNGKHDDQLDATTQVLNYLLYTVGVESSKKEENDAKIRIREWTQDMYEDYYGGNPSQRDQMIRLWGFPKYGFTEED